MAVAITANIVNGRQFIANLEGLRPRVKEAAMRGMIKGADELRDYIKYQVLDGQLVKRRSGQLQKSLYIRRNKDSLTIFFKGIHTAGGDPIPNAVLANILEEGLNKKWFQPKRNRWHYGIRAHYFMRTSLIGKKRKIVQYVNQEISLELRRKTRV